MKAWHFAGTQMRDGKPLGAPGEIEIYDGSLTIRERGLHASDRLLDALQYAPGPLLWRVRMDLEGAVLEIHERDFAAALLWSGRELLSEHDEWSCNCAVEPCSADPDYRDE